MCVARSHAGGESSMHSRRIVGGVMALMAAVVLAGSALLGGGAAARAGPATRANQMSPAFGTPHETSKVTLRETSIDGPAFWTQESDGASQLPLPINALTGTDHRLNVN